MFEITITEIKELAEHGINSGEIPTTRIDRLKMTIDGELDIQSIIKSVTAPKRKRNAKKAAA